MIARSLAQAQPGDPRLRARLDCVRNNGTFCWGWFGDNWGKVFQPALLEHLWLTLIAVGIGFVIAFAAALFAYRMRWFETPFTLLTGFLYTIPSLALFQLLVPVTGLTTHDRRDRAGLLHAADPVPQHAARPARGARRRARGRARDGPDPAPEPRAGRAAARAAGDRGRHPGGHGDGDQPRDDRRLRGRPGPRRRRSATALQKNFNTEFIAAGALAVALALVADGLIVVVQRLLTPWARRTA